MAEVRLEVHLAHPPDRVWRALTEAELLGAWFMPTDLDPREGGRFTLDPGTLAGFVGLVSGELTEVAAPHRMVMLWQGEKLHTRVTWEVVGTADGCRLRVVQTGFIGAPAALRRRALRDTYTRLFSERLPVVLDQLATGAAGHGGPSGTVRAGASLRAAVPRSAAVPQSTPVRRSAAVPQPTPVPQSTPVRRSAVVPQPTPVPQSTPVRRSAVVPRSAGVPRQRRPGANVAVGAWLAGRTLAPPAERAAEADHEAVRTSGVDGELGVAGRVPGPRVVAEPGYGRVPGAGMAGEPADRSPGPGRDPARSPGRELGEVVPAWVRAVVIAAAAAVLAVAVLAAVAQPGRDTGIGDLPGGPDGSRDGPGLALQPGAVTSHHGPAGEPGAGSPGAGPGGPLAGLPGAATGDGDPAAAGGQGTPGRGVAPETTLASGPPAPVLAARLTTSGALLGLGGRAVAVTVSNPGPGSAAGWEVTVDVGDQAVTNVSGAAYQRVGTAATFTPLDSPLPAGGSAEFSFDLPAPVLGLLGASDPTGCTIDGQPCG